MSEKKNKSKKIPQWWWSIYDDIVEGYSRSEIWRKYEAGEYANPLDVDDLESVFNDEYNAVIKMYAKDIEFLPIEERTKMYNRYLRVYRMAMDRGRFSDARQILDSMVRLAGSSAEQGKPKVEIGSDNGTITVSFGLKEE